MTEYLTIRRNIDIISNSEEKAILELNKYFNKDDFFVELKDGLIEIHLNVLDIKFLEELITKISKMNNLRENNILNQIYLIIDSVKSYGIKSGKRLYVNYNAERKVKGRAKKIEDRGMYYYARNNNFSKINNELPIAFENKILCGDSEEILKNLPDNSIDLIFTSPPYNFGLQYENSEDGIDWNKYFDKLFKIFYQCIRVLKYGGRIIVNVQPLYSDYIPIHHIISNYFMENKLIWRSEILWEKHNYNAKYTAWGSWKSPSNPYLKYTWEYLEVFSKGTLKHEGSSDNIDISDEEFKKWVYAKWEIAPERNMNAFQHPAMFPEKLVERILKLFSFENDIILDPFNGVGTTTKMAKQLGRRFLGIDVSEEYTSKAIERLNNEIDNKAKKMMVKRHI